jgi:hypothetical protein
MDFIVNDACCVIDLMMVYDVADLQIYELSNAWAISTRMPP